MLRKCFLKKKLKVTFHPSEKKKSSLKSPFQRGYQADLMQSNRVLLGQSQAGSLSLRGFKETFLSLLFTALKCLDLRLCRMRDGMKQM